MSIENLFNDSAKKKALKALADKFDSILQTITDLDISDDEGTLNSDDIRKHLVKVYTGRRETIASQVNMDADITVVKKTRTKRAPVAEGDAPDEVEKPSATNKPATPAKKTTNGKKDTGADMA